MLALLAALVALARWQRPLLVGVRAIMLVPLVTSAALFCWRDSSWLTGLNAVALLASAGLCAASVPQLRLRTAAIADVASAWRRAAVSAVVGAAQLVVADVAWSEFARGVRSRGLVAALRGVVLALPLLLLFGTLFAAADVVFGELVGAAVPDVRDPATHVLVVLAWAWLAAGTLRAFLRPPSSAAASAREEPRRDGGGTEVVVALALVDVLFLAFVVVQLRYFFGGADLVERTTGLTYAEYARQGFFELLAVAALVLPLLLVGDWLVRRGRRGFRLLALVLVALLAVVIASALERMRLYQLEFGLTEARVYATAFMLWLTAVFAWLALSVLRGRRDRFAGGALAAAFAAVLALNAVNPDALIASTNIDRWREGKLFDVYYLGELSDDATPTLVRELPTLAAAGDAGAAAVAQRLLSDAERRRDWRSWSLSRSRAEEAVRAHEDELQAVVRAAPAP